MTTNNAVSILTDAVCYSAGSCDPKRLPKATRALIDDLAKDMQPTYEAAWNILDRFSVETRNNWVYMIRKDS